MTYYDHATAMTFKLDRWREERVPRNYELEAVASEQGILAAVEKKPSMLRRCVSVFRRPVKTDAVDTSKL